MNESTANNSVTTEQFVVTLCKEYAELNNNFEQLVQDNPASAHPTCAHYDLLMSCYERGFLELQDVYNATLPLERRATAAILHRFLRTEANEPDETDWDRATVLVDLYECRVCADHIAQVYLKGIMTPVDSNRFGTHEIVTIAEANEFIDKTIYPEKRD